MNEQRPDNIDSLTTPQQSAEESDLAGMSAADVRSLARDLQAHQGELQLRCEQLLQAQVELADSRDRYSELYNFAPVGFVTLDGDGRVCEANFSAASTLGVERRELLDANLREFVAPQAREEFHIHLQAVFTERGYSSQSGQDSLEDAARGDNQTCRLDLRRADGMPLVVRLQSVVVGAAANQRCLTTLIDVTEAVTAQGQVAESERRFRRLAEAVTDYIYHVQVEDGRAVQTVHGVNSEAVTGYTPDELRTNHLLWIAMVPREDRPLVERQAAAIVAVGDAPPIEHRIVRKDGRIRWVSSTLSPQYDAHGNLMGYDGLIRDVTDRKEAEEALEDLNRQLEQRVAERTQETRLLAEAVSHLGEGVVITADELDWPGPTIVFVNEAMVRITGYSADELIGNTPRILQGEGTDRAALDRLKEDLSAGKPSLVELTNYRKDGKPYDAELFVTPLYNADGRRTHFVSIHRDVSERKRFERSLHESRERMRAILDTAADAIITIDQHGVIQGVNKATDKMFGYTGDELVGQNVKMLMPPPYQNEHDGYLARYMETGEATIIGVGREVLGRRKDGSTFPIELAVSQVDHLGIFTGIIRDVTERKKTEQALQREHDFSQSIIDTAQQIIVVLDTHGRIVRFNPHIEQLTGWQFEEVRGKNWFEIFLPERERPRIFNIFQRAVGGRRTRGNVNAVVTKNGRELEVEWYDAPLTSSEGELIGLLCTGQDVTERRKLEREVLEIAAEEQRRIGHELHDDAAQQLGALNILLDTLASSLRDQASPDADLAEKIHQQAAKVLDRIRALSRGVSPVEVDAQGLTHSLRIMAEETSRLHSVACSFDTSESIPIDDNMTATQLYYIAREAVTNALKHSRASNLHINLEISDEEIVLEIADDGVGINSGMEPKETLGLRIMEHRASLIGARLAVEPASPHGTRVACRLRAQ